MKPEELEATLATAHNLLVAEGMTEAASLVSQYPARLENTHYDNWNGGTYSWTICFDVPAQVYARLASQRKTIEEQIDGRLKEIFETDENNYYGAKIVPAKVADKDWRAEGSSLPRDVRKNIVDGMRLEGVPWQGSLNDVEFLSRLYDLDQLHSTDRRYTDAAGDIWQHTVNNDDWDADSFAVVTVIALQLLRYLASYTSLELAARRPRWNRHTPHRDYTGAQPLNEKQAKPAWTLTSKGRQ